jgi:D-cysteine desulfhydrase
LEGAFPRLRLGTFPTPVHRMDRASDRTEAEIWVKRDDKSGERYGGNHLRKIELLLAEAQRKKKKRILTYSCLGSNYAVAMALYGQQVSLPCDVVMSYKLPSLGLRHNLLLTNHFGARIHYARTFLGAGILLSKLYGRSALADNCFPYVTRAGASTPLGAMGFVLAGLEIAKQIREGDCPTPDVLFVTVSSCGTVAGLAVGLALAELSVPIIGVRVVDSWMANRAHINRLVRGVEHLIRNRLPKAIPQPRGLSLPSLELCHDYFGEGYGAPTEKADAAVLSSGNDGLRLENTYTGKTFAAVNDWGMRPENRGKTALFWNTYNSVDLSGIIAQLDWRDLPKNLWQFFESADFREVAMPRAK